MLYLQFILVRYLVSSDNTTKPMFMRYKLLIQSVNALMHLNMSINPVK